MALSSSSSTTIGNIRPARPGIVRITGTVQFVPASDSSSTAAAMMVHLNHYYRHVPVMIRFDGGSNGTEKSDAGSQTYMEPVEFELTGNGERPTDYDDTVVVRVWTKLVGVQQIVCWSAEGWCYWGLSKLYSELSKAPRGQSIVVHKPVYMHVVKNSERPETASIGEVRLCIRRLDNSYGFSDDMQFTVNGRLIRQVRARYGRSISAHVVHERAVEQTLIIVKRNTNRIRMIDYKNDVVQRAGELPCFAFLFGPVPTSSVAYWQTVYQMIMARGEMELYKKLPEITREAILAVKMVTFLVQWLEYLPDIFMTTMGDRFEADYFADALVTLSDDCDGLTKAILMSTLSLLRLADNVQLPTELIPLVRILRHYIPVAMLCGTTSEAASSSGSNNHSNEVSGAHFAALFVPVDYFVEAVGRGNSKHPIAQLELTDAERSFSRQLPVLYGEGTGRIEPYGIMDPLPEVRDRIFTPAMEEQCRTDIFYGRQEGTHFIVWPVSGTTRAFIDGRYGEQKNRKPINVGSFYFAHMDKQRRYCRGVAYADIIQRGKNVIILPMDMYADSEIAYIKTECSMCPPVVSLVPPRIARLPNQNADLDRLAVQFTSRSGAKFAVCHNDAHINLFVRLEAMNAYFITLLEEVIANNDVVGIQYWPERPITNVEGYLIRLYLKDK